MEYRESDLVLEVSKNVDPNVWDEGKYAAFFDLLFRDRVYQKEAAETALRYLSSGVYSCMEDLARENFAANEVIRERFYGNLSAFLEDIGLPDRLSGTIDLATGTGKSYVMYALAVCMLAEGKVDRVLVLTPSVTIERELTQKFSDLAQDEHLNAALGGDYIPPSIINGAHSIVENTIVIENRDAVYKSQENRNSIVDSLSGRGERTLVLNDEVHHVFYTENNQWKYFIEDEGGHDIHFRYVIGFTGTAYKCRAKTKSGAANEYLSDVIYRYSLREAIEQGFVKDIEYVDKEDMPKDKDDRWKVIVDSHEKIAEQLARTAGVRPVTIIVTGEKRKADGQAKKFRAFLKKHRNLTEEEAGRLVLCVHSGNSAAVDRLRLKDVDKPDNVVEYIFSVSMLTEGWDVKRVFQIVPDEERAFNSKLLIAQVLGRGLRRPVGWQSEWGVPKVIVFNHESWAPKVKTLVDELLDFKKTITTGIAQDSVYHFQIRNVSYKTEETANSEKKNQEPMAFLELGYVRLPTDSEQGKVETELLAVSTNRARNRTLSYTKDSYSVSQMAQEMFDKFSDLPTEEKKDYYESLWPVEKLEAMIERSLTESSNKVITKKLKQTFINAMNVLFRDYTKSVSYTSSPDDYAYISTTALRDVTTELSLLRRNKALFYADHLEKSSLDDVSRASLSEIEDTMNGYSHQKVENSYCFKTPQLGIVTTGEPERKFVKRLTDPQTARQIDAFVKSNDTGFYEFEYTWRKGTHQQSGTFNPDFFIRKKDVIVVVEIKDDGQLSNPDPENVGKYRAAQKHFRLLNEHGREAGEEGTYKMTFLTPKSYERFFEQLTDSDPQAILHFNSELDVRLDEKVRQSGERKG